MLRMYMLGMLNASFTRKIYTIKSQNKVMALITCFSFYFV